MKTFDLKPQLFDTLKSYNKKNFMSDLMAGIIVGIVALPLAIAFGIGLGRNTRERHHHCHRSRFPCVAARR